MKSALLLAILPGAAGLPAQTPQIFLELPGPWTVLESGKPPREIALPPRPREIERPCLIERKVQLPSEGLSGLALLATAFDSPYDVRINGQIVGRYGDPDSIVYPAPQPRVYAIPDGLLHPGENELAFHIERRSLFDNVGTPFSGAPTLGGRAPLDEMATGRIRTRQVRALYLPSSTAAGLLFAAILWFTSRRSRYRRTLLWMSLYFLSVFSLFDIPLTLQIFAGIGSPTVRIGLLPLSFLLWEVAQTEASLAMFEWHVPLILRLGYYSGVFIGALVWPNFAVLRDGIAVCLSGTLLALALRQRNRPAAIFLGLLASYNLVSFAGVSSPVVLRLSLGPVDLHIVPIFRLLIGVALILYMVRQSSQDRAERERLAGEIEAARTVQQLLFPRPSTGNIEAIYSPASELGGDFWQALPAADGGEIVVVGDVSGKGLRAAMVVSLLTGALRNRKSDRPAEILCELNRVAASALRSGFVTALVAHLRDGRAVVANAGHPAPYLDGRELKLDPALPLGIDADAVYTEREFDLGRQMTFLSDGVIEASNPAGDLFGFERTAAISTQPAQAIAEAARAWGQNDDITVVTVRGAR